LESVPGSVGSIPRSAYWLHQEGSLLSGRCDHESAWGEGESPTIRLEYLGGGEGQESIGSGVFLTGCDSGTDFRSEQGFEVIGTGLTEAASDGLSQIRLHRFVRSCACPVGGSSRSLDLVRFGGLDSG